MNYATFSKKKEKRGAQDCVDLRAISLVSYASKIVLKILTHRLESTAEVNLGKDQFGFMKGRVTPKRCSCGTVPIV